MKLIVNRSKGKFELNKDWTFCNCPPGCNNECRKCPTLIRGIEEGYIINGESSLLLIADIPDSCTDYMIESWEGLERIIFVEEGKLYITE